jgi:hypothetical protein
MDRKKIEQEVIARLVDDEVQRRTKEERCEQERREDAARLKEEVKTSTRAGRNFWIGRGPGQKESWPENRQCCSWPLFFLIQVLCIGVPVLLGLKEEGDSGGVFMCAFGFVVLSLWCQGGGAS